MAQIRFRKISLRELIDSLIVFYDGGADYIDIVGELGDEQDKIGLAVLPEYIAEESELEYIDDEENEFEEHAFPKLTDDDINSCIG